MVCLHFEKTLKNGKRASIWVSNKSSRPRELEHVYFPNFVFVYIL